MHRVVLRLIFDAVVVAAALFGVAGTWDWWRAWVLLLVLFVIRLGGARVVFAANPALMLERARPPLCHGQSRRDRALVLIVLASGFVGLPIVSGLDRFWWPQLAPPPTILSALGLGLFASGWVLKNLALRANAFAVAAVRIQHEREHVVVDSGIYGIVRHPFYAADPLIFVGLGLWLQSYVALWCSVIPIAVLIVRLRGEEQVLQRELLGYRAYMQRVPSRLFPGIW